MNFTVAGISDQAQGVLITTISERDSVYLGSAKWILLVEKEVCIRASL